MLEPVWITHGLAVAIHDRQLAEHGGTPGVRDEGLLDSALARPQQTWAYSEDIDMPALAGAYAIGLARNHPFVDGNKRTAYVLCRTFLVLNAWDMTAPMTERYRAIMALAAGELDEDGFVEWLRAHARPEEVSESRAVYE